MCKEDIRIGRKLDVQYSTFTGTQDVAAVCLTADANRIVVTFTRATTNGATEEKGVSISVLVNNAHVPIAVVSREHPVHTLRIEDYGSAITGEIWATRRQTDGNAMGIVVGRLTQKLEDV